MIQCILIKRGEDNNPPESTVPLTDADTTQHSLLVRPVLAQELAYNVSTQAEADHNQLGLGVCPLDVTNQGCELPCAPCKIKSTELPNQYRGKHLCRTQHFSLVSSCS